MKELLKILESRRAEQRLASRDMDVHIKRLTEDEHSFVRTNGAAMNGFLGGRLSEIDIVVEIVKERIRINELDTDKT